MNVNTMPGDDGMPEKSLIRLQEAGFAVFPSAERAATALARVYRYYRWRGKRGLDS
jgi:acyl-CoA synthetase (NDP forming)